MSEVKLLKLGMVNASADGGDKAILAVGAGDGSATDANIARVALGVPNTLHRLADAYVDALGFMPSGIGRISSFFQILENGGILDELVDGAYFGTDGNHSTDTPISLRGVEAAAIADNFTRSTRGLTATQASLAGIGFDITDTPTGTLCVDCVSAGTSDLGIGYGIAAVIGNSANADDITTLHWNGTSRQEMNYYVGGAYQAATSMPLIGNVSREFTRRSMEPQICVWTYGNTDVKCWYQGIASHPTPDKSIPASAVEQNRVSLFARNATDSTFTATGTPLKGTITSWLIFNRELTDAEAKVATRAMRCLRPEPITLIIEGDSNGREYSELDPTTHFPYKLRSYGDWDSLAWQTNCCSSGHAITAVATYGFADQWAFMRARDHVQRAIVMFSPVGVNDIGQGETNPATMWTNFKAILRQARNMGFETLIMTIPMVASPTFSEAQRNVVRAFNRLMYEERSEATYFIDAARFLGDRTNQPAYWTDDSHPSGDGWDLVAAEINRVVGDL